MPRPHWRKMTWVIIAWCVLMAIWIIAGIANSDSASHCAHETYRGACEAGSTAGTGIAVVALWFIWFFGFVILSLIWFMSRPKGRVCPACGERVKRGLTTCKNCGHDFAAAVGLPPAASQVGQAGVATASGGETISQLQDVGQSTPQVPAGWHPDPRGSSSERYWDGQSWTDKIRKPVD